MELLCYKQANGILIALLEHPLLISASSSFQLIPKRMISASENPGLERLMEHRWVYIFQREYATVDPAYVDVCSISVCSLF